MLRNTLLKSWISYNVTISNKGRNHWFGYSYTRTKSRLLDHYPMRLSRGNYFHLEFIRLLKLRFGSILDPFQSASEIVHSPISTYQWTQPFTTAAMWNSKPLGRKICMLMTEVTSISSHAKTIRGTYSSVRDDATFLQCHPLNLGFCLQTAGHWYCLWERWPWCHCSGHCSSSGFKLVEKKTHQVTRYSCKLISSIVNTGPTGPTLRARHYITIRNTISDWWSIYRGGVWKLLIKGQVMNWPPMNSNPNSLAITAF